MYLSHVEVSGIRGFHGNRSVLLDLARGDGSYAGWTVFAGRNGSGKTTLLRAIALAVSGPGVARNLVPDFSNWVSKRQSSATSTLGIKHDPAFDESTAQTPEPTVPPLDVTLAWAIRDATPQGGQPSLTAAFTSSRHEPTLPALWSENPAGWFCAAYGPFRRLAGGTGEAQRLMLSPGPVSRMATLFHEDASLAEGVSWLIDQHLRALENRPGARELKDAAVAVLADGLLPDGYTVTRVDSEGLWVRDTAGSEFPLREMSDGYRTVAALVVDLLKQIHHAYGRLPIDEANGAVSIDAPGVVIIDEVDAHLHVSWQQRIGNWLKTHFPRIQFLVTTHSPYICQAADDNGLFRLPGPDEDVAPRPVSRDLYERIVFGTGDDAVLSELFGLDTPYSERAQLLRHELVNLEVAVLAGRADAAQQARYAQLKEQLTSSPVTRVAEVSAVLKAIEGDAE